MKKLILCIVFGFITHTLPLLSQRLICPDSCAYFPDSLPNSISIRYDSCMTDYFGDANYHYAKNNFLLDLPYAAVSLDTLSEGAVVFLDWKNEIAPSFTVLLNLLQSLETEVGSFRLKRRRPNDANSRYFVLGFDQWVRIDSIKSLFNDPTNVGVCTHSGMIVVSKIFEVPNELYPSVQVNRQEKQITVRAEKAIQDIKIWDQEGRLLATSQENSILHIPNYSAPTLIFIQITCDNKTYLLKEIFL